MQAERLKILHSLVQDEPNEPFNWYALAMEYVGKDEAKALTMLEDTVKRFPDYLASYYQLASLQLNAERYEQAKTTAESGLDVAHEQQNIKAVKELSGLLQQILDEMMFDE